MNRNQLIEAIAYKKSFLVVGLDTDRNLLPPHLRNDPQGPLRFNQAIIEATAPYCVGYKLNTAFYEAEGTKGWDCMEATLRHIPATHFTIADAKRGDIGNTSSLYARAFFETLSFDAITVAPYMGEDSIRPFLEYKDKWTIVLGLTSNKGAFDFQKTKLCGNEQASERYLYQQVMESTSKWGSPENLMFVVGATRSDELLAIRQALPDHFLLVPGIGAQGGSLSETCKHGLTKDYGLLVNASRAILYANNSESFAEKAAAIARAYQADMKAEIEGASFARP